MKNHYFLLLLICSQLCFSQADISEEEKTENLIRVWGLVKYQHPEISRGNFDINDEFLRQLEKPGDNPEIGKEYREINSNLFGMKSGKTYYILSYNFRK